jgi:hypothetical protein
MNLDPPSHLYLLLESKSKVFFTVVEKRSCHCSHKLAGVYKDHIQGPFRVGKRAYPGVTIKLTKSISRVPKELPTSTSRVTKKLTKSISRVTSELTKSKQVQFTFVVN